MSGGPVAPKPRFRIYRAADAVAVDKDLMPLIDMQDEDVAGLTEAMDAGFAEGATSRLVMADAATGLSLTYARFRAGH